MLIVLGTFPVSIEISLVDRFTRNKVALNSATLL